MRIPHVSMYYDVKNAFPSLEFEAMDKQVVGMRKKTKKMLPQIWREAKMEVQASDAKVVIAPGSGVLPGHDVAVGFVGKSYQDCVGPWMDEAAE